MIAGKTILDARAATPVDFSFATVEVSAQLPPTPTPPAQAPSVALSPQVVPAAIEKALDAVVGEHEVSLDTPDPAIKVITRRLADADVYFLFNEGAEAATRSVTFRGKGQKVEVWDPESGAVTSLASTHDNSGTTIKLDLKPYDTRLLVIR